jgi:hypothetical protein
MRTNDDEKIVAITKIVSTLEDKEEIIQEELNINNKNN